MIKAEIIADSINPVGDRVTSWILEYPRFIHAEIMTHRAFSKNAASSRAIPVEKMIQQIIDNPAMPVWWGKNQSGMQAKEELDNILAKHPIWTQDGNSKIYIEKKVTDLEYAKAIWLNARDKAIEYVQSLVKLGLHKQIANRILEPWFNIRVILTGTDFENFFALRAHNDAQPEFQALAYKMLELYNASEPKQLKPGEWHIPFGDKFDESRLWDLVNSWEHDRQYEPADVYFGTNEKGFKEAKIKIAIARCARVSYFNFEGKDDYAADIKICEKLFGSIPRHLSPTEHVALCLPDSTRFGNLTGWKQYRYTYSDQNLSDGRVKKKK